MKVDYGKEKASIVFKDRGINLYIIATMIESGDFIGVEPHPRRANQVVFSVLYNDYVIAVPCVPNNEGYFIKTAWYDRDLNDLYNGGSNEQ